LEWVHDKFRQCPLCPHDADNSRPTRGGTWHALTSASKSNRSGRDFRSLPSPYEPRATALAALTTKKCTSHEDQEDIHENHENHENSTSGKRVISTSQNQWSQRYEKVLCNTSHGALACGRKPRGCLASANQKPRFSLHADLAFLCMQPLMTLSFLRIADIFCSRDLFQSLK
jgi:hypothetical protein